MEAIFSGRGTVIPAAWAAPASPVCFLPKAARWELTSRRQGHITDAGLAFHLQITVNVERSGDLLAGNVKTFGERPTTLAALEGGSFLVAESTSLLRNVAVAWDSANSRYLFVWSEPRVLDCFSGAWCYDRIYAQLVGPDGTLIGSRSTILEYLGSAAGFRLAYGSVSHSYILVYANNDIVLSAAWFGVQALDATGAPVGTVYYVNDRRVGDLIYVPTVNEFALSNPPTERGSLVEARYPAGWPVAASRSMFGLRLSRQ
jgi:hypothetical protein